MKIKTKRSEDGTVYVCPICKKEDLDRSYIEECIELHKEQANCKHDETETNIHLTSDFTRYLEKSCTRCNKILAMRAIPEEKYLAMLESLLEDN